MRIQLRAIERGGELLQAVKPARGTGKATDLSVKGGTPPNSRRLVADAAGLSPDQAKTMLRVANAPTTIVAILTQGKKRSSSHLRSLTPVREDAARQTLQSLKGFTRAPFPKPAPSTAMHRTSVTRCSKRGMHSHLKNLSGPCDGQSIRGLADANESRLAGRYY
jgi:hypothetical protein